MKYSLWHYLVMAAYSEIINLIWLGFALAIAVGRWVIFKFSQGDFLRIVVSLPLIVAGASVGLFKLHEIVLVIFRTKRLEAICLLCKR